MLYLGSLRASVVFVPLDAGYTVGEIGCFLGDAQPTLVVCRPSSRRRSPNWDGSLRFPCGALGDPGRGRGKRSGTQRRAMSKCRAARATWPRSSTHPAPPAEIQRGHAHPWQPRSNAATLRGPGDFAADDPLFHALPIFHTHGLFVATNVTLLAGS